MKLLKDYEVDEIVSLLQDFRRRVEEEPEVQEEIDSVLELLEEKDNESN